MGDHIPLGSMSNNGAYASGSSGFPEDRKQSYSRKGSNGGYGKGPFEVSSGEVHDYDNSDSKSYKSQERERKESVIAVDMNITEADLVETEAKLGSMTLDSTIAIMKEVFLMHQHDQNFPHQVLENIKIFINDPDVLANPHEHEELIREMKLEAILVTENSPYAEVRAVVDNTDDPSLPVGTFRAWFIGILFVIGGAFINQLFSVRQPAITVYANVAQLLAYPAGRLLALVLPDWGFTFKGTRYTMNPGPFNHKEHMLITIMANVGFNTPYTENIILSQYLKIYFNQAFAASFSYQILIGLGTNFVGFGLAGICRRFLVYPSYTVWPTSLVTIALNRAFHAEANIPVQGPFKKTYTWSRMKLFTIAFFGMFIYFWLPDFLFPALSYFNWISWIAPNNQVLNNICGSVNGLGLNPWPTFDWNIIAFQYDPLVIPFFSSANQLAGMVVGFFMIVGMYWTNAWNTSYLPINSNHIFDNKGAAYNVSRAVDSRGILDEAKYQQYSMPWMAAGNLTIYFWFFAVYTSTLSYAMLFHRHEIATGFKQIFKKKTGAADLTKDVHWRLMGSYKEVPEWWFMIVLAVAAALGMAGIGAYQTYTSPAVVIFGIALALLFVVPVGIVYSITGIQVTLNVIAEFIGGGFVKGNALSMNFFKAFGYITTAQALFFSNDLKLAHYVKIPPRTTFAAQLIATFISTFICTGVFNFQMHIDGICTTDAPWGFTCPGINTFFTAAVFWGTLGPHKLFGAGPYNLLLIGFAVGAVLPFMGLAAKKIWPHNALVRQFHPVLFCVGGLLWAPYNFSYYIPAMPVAYLSWMYIRPRYLAFWAKYNYVLAAALTAGVALSAVIIFFCVQYTEVPFEWWGTDVSFTGCEGTACRRFNPKTDLPAKGYFGPDPGNYP